MFVPDVAVAGAVFTIERSATRWAVVVAMEIGRAACRERVGLAAAAVAVLVMGPGAAGLMWTAIGKVWVALGARVPKVQVTVPAALVQPALAETMLSWAGNTSSLCDPISDVWSSVVTVRV